MNLFLLVFFYNELAITIVIDGSFHKTIKSFDVQRGAKLAIRIIKLSVGECKRKSVHAGWTEILAKISASALGPIWNITFQVHGMLKVKDKVSQVSSVFGIFLECHNGNGCFKENMAAPNYTLESSLRFALMPLMFCNYAERSW